MPGFVAQVHDHFLARILEEVIVDQLPKQSVGQVPGHVDAVGTVGGPEVVVAEVVSRNEADFARAQLAGDLGQAVEEHVLDLQSEVADATGKEFLQANFPHHRIVGDGPYRVSLGPDSGHRHDDPTFTMSASSHR